MKPITKKELRDLVLASKDISNIDYSHITDMISMFTDCSSIEVPNDIKYTFNIKDHSGLIN